MTLNDYLDLITSLYRGQPSFMAMCQALAQPLVDVQALLEEIRVAFDLDTAIGVQLDQDGEWVGRNRYLDTPLEGVYFSWAESGVGWNEGAWKGPYDPATGITTLVDDFYRILLRARIAANSWDGTTASAYDVWSALFGDTGMLIVIQDRQDMTMVMGLAGVIPDAVFRALFTGGYLPLKPAGVRIKYYALPVVEGPLFAWDCDSAALSGWEASWPELITA